MRRIVFLSPYLQMVGLVVTVLIISPTLPVGAWQCHAPTLNEEQRRKFYDLPEISNANKSCESVSQPQTGLEIPENLTYEPYVNQRFNYSVQYPSNLLIPQGKPTNADGQRFLTPNRRIEMTAFGAHNVFSETLRARYESTLADDSTDDRRITYRTIGDRFFVVSGYVGDRIFYEKTVLENNDFITLRFVYDRDLQPEFGPILTTITQSFPDGSQ